MACGSGRSYGAALTALNVGVAPTTNIAEISGSATKKIRLTRVAVSGTILTTAQDFDLQLVKESSASTGGVAVTAIDVPFDSVNPPGTAVVRGFTTSPVTGTVVGQIAVSKLSLVVAPAVVSSVVWDFATLSSGNQPTLETAAEAYALTLNGATPGFASSLDIYFWWTEAPLNS
jgi:hypothetical protein